MKEQYQNLGELDVEYANSANIPVDIWLSPFDTSSEDWDDDYGDMPLEKGWKLSADNYMPRKGRCSGEGSYVAVAEDRQVLVALVHKHWLTLYQQAVTKLTQLKQDDDDGTASLYYWD